MNSSPILIIGSGAMACLFASRLASAGQKVYMVDAWENGIRAIKENGVTLFSDDEQNHQKIEAFYHFEQVPHCHFALVLVKSWQTIWAALFLKNHLDTNGWAITLQNGIGNAEILKKQLGDRRVAMGVTTMGGTLVSPGIVKGFANGVLTLQDSPNLNLFFDQLSAAGFKLDLNTNIDQIVWGKLVINAAINPLTALFEVPNGKLLEMPSAMQLIDLLINEAFQIAVKLGVVLPYADPLEQVKSVLLATAANYSSMYQDIKRGAPTEIEQINGAIARLGQANRIPTPYNDCITTLIKGKVEKYNLRGEAHESHLFN